jgi:thiosulfate/3-mercaptopyruvate sulfurtransferase
MHQTLISASELKSLLDSGPAPVLLDVRFDLSNPVAGEQAHAQGHVPGAHHLHLDRDLAGEKQGPDGRFRGRHPLPPREDFAALAGSLGITPGMQVVVYDAQGGLYAARAWWMLRWIGHRAVALLDGGLQAWTQAGGALDTAAPRRDAAAPPYPLGPQAMPSIEADALLRPPGHRLVVDARAPERYRGEVEPLDRVAGHIPGAVNRFLQSNLQPDGRFKDAGALRAEFDALLAGRDPSQVVHQCGSGVSACANLLAMEHAGLRGSALYPGSWSEWSSDPARPVERA